MFIIVRLVCLNFLILDANSLKLLDELLFYLGLEQSFCFQVLGAFCCCLFYCSFGFWFGAV